MEDLLGVGASAATGGVFGVLGAAAGRVAGVFELRESHRQERARWEHEARMHALALKAAEARSWNWRIPSASL